MRNLFKASFCIAPSIFPLYVYAAGPALTAQQEDAFKIAAAVQELYDSNYTRTPDKVSEQITQSSLGLSLNETWSNQRLSVRWLGTHFSFDTLDADADLQKAEFDWKSLWPKGFKSSLSLKQDGYLVDQLEFSGVDVSTQDLAVARFGYGFRDGWSFNLGGRGFKQLHSNDVRRSLEYDEADGFAEISYATPIGSSVAIRGRNGKRTYQEDALVIDDVNFEYKQAEIETKWVLSSKTDIELLVAGYDRIGAVNDGSGTSASLEANWVPTEKLEFKSSYSLQHPAIGENDDGTSKIQTTLVSAQWQLTSRLALATRLSYTRTHYLNTDPLLERNEGLFNYLPISITYTPGTHWQIKADTGWRKNTSPLTYRQYISAQANLGLFFAY